jgi:hypothetical protein
LLTPGEKNLEGVCLVSESCQLYTFLELQKAASYAQFWNLIFSKKMKKEKTILLPEFAE